MAKPREKARPQAPRAKAGPAEHASRNSRGESAPPATVSGRWLVKAIGATLAAAALCCWGTLCLLFWQGSWQLLYHPSPIVTRTPANAGLRFDSIAFAASELGQARLTGWWIAAGRDAKFQRYTVLYLHGQNGNLGDTVDALAALHAAGVNVLAFDYRGYGQSQHERPSEAHWREDAGWALDYLTGTRHVAAASIVIAGEGLGADLALAMAAEHSEIAGVIMRDPVPDAANAIFNDGRAKLVPARLLVRDRYDLDAPAAALRIPLFWSAIETPQSAGRNEAARAAYSRVNSKKMLVWLYPGPSEERQMVESLSRWLADLPPAGH